ncbi:MAG: glycosyltransferase [Calditrichota bacterium]
MRVLHLSTASTWRGGEQQLAYLLEELRQENVQQFVLCRKNSAMQAFCEEKGFRFFAANKSSSIDPRYSRSCAVYVRRFEPHIVHAHDSHAHSLALYSRLFWRPSLRLVVSRRVDFPVGNGLAARWKYSNSEVRRILCVSGAIQQVMSESVDPSMLDVVYSGIDMQRMSAEPDGRLRKLAAVPPKTKLVGNVAALAPHKDYPTFLKTAAAVVESGKDVHFFIIGKGELEDEMKSFADNLGIGRRVTFCGFRDDIPTILPELDVFLITSETEGLGTSILDAFACEVPVVATAAGGIPELVIDNVTGLLCKVKHSTELAKAIIAILDKPKEADLYTKNALKHLEGFKRSATAAKTLSIYKNILKQEHISV